VLNCSAAEAARRYGDWLVMLSDLDFHCEAQMAGDTTDAGIS
jgi:hypothetical protein